MSVGNLEAAGAVPVGAAVRAQLQASCKALNSPFADIISSTTPKDAARAAAIGTIVNTALGDMKDVDADKKDLIIGLTTGMVAKVFGRNSPLSHLLEDPVANKDAIAGLIKVCGEASIERAGSMTHSGIAEADTAMGITVGAAIAQTVREKNKATIHIVAGGDTPEISFRGGRLKLDLAAELDFLKETLSDTPVNPKTLEHNMHVRNPSPDSTPPGSPPLTPKGHAK
jgi:hypothetical protein